MTCYFKVKLPRVLVCWVSQLPPFYMRMELDMDHYIPGALSDFGDYQLLRPFKTE